MSFEHSAWLICFRFGSVAGVEHRAAIGVGANLPSGGGAPEQTVAAALEELAGAGRVVARSSLYRTAPVDREDQPGFVNAAAVVETDLEAEALLDFLLGLERRYGRDRTGEVQKGPRALDLDLLLMDGVIVRTPRLTVPHPELERRRFVLAPLAEIAAEWRHPVSGLTMAELLAAVPDEGANRVESVRKIGAERGPKIELGQPPR
ncbi:MAG TPA: 2-amino-4-hydroxy-6-hydroxymethyldihydropteridine diphosphokinase [Acidobacteriaceae bacterium]|nr:2-amino-4-hydroxy-6-hydroxymethyldihydropteridine diphosphokinase [Acidobacteriaceae bacterium]